MRYKLSVALALTLSANALFAANSTDLNKTNDAATTQNDTSLAEVQVVGDLSKTEGTGSYTADRMNTATGLGLSIKETPQSVSVISNQLIKDLNLKDVLVTGRAGMVGARSKDEIAVMALRGGDVVGRHTVGFYNDGEFIELNHTATSRATFSKGAIKAAIWLKDQSSGLYSIDDSLGLDD